MHALEKKFDFSRWAKIIKFECIKQWKQIPTVIGKSLLVSQKK